MIDGIWRPTGVPAVYKLIEGFEERNIEIKLVFTCKDYEYHWKKTKDETLRIHGLKTKITVLAGGLFFTWGPRIIKGYLREIRQTYLILKIFKTFKPDIIYFDRANFIPAAFFARFFSTRVVIRMMGVGTSFLRKAISGRNIKHFILRWAFRSPFSFVICTQDGSGAESWLHQILPTKVPRAFMFNGVDYNAKERTVNTNFADLPKDRTIVLFVGRLEKLKGCEEFLEGFLFALKNDREHLHALIVGGGSLSGKLHQMVEERCISNSVTFMGELPHDQIIGALLRSDIYVSLNRGGNLSNTNLEAMRAGCCMIIPASQPDRGIDIVTDEMIPNDAVFRIPGPDDTVALSEAILYFHRNKEEGVARGQAISEIAKSLIPSWDDRISKELNILESLIR
ncbi:glycosyltransferase family 4 protein [Thermodesulfobacteriota bacterium]